MIALPTIPSWNVMYFIRIKIYYRAIHAKIFICLFSNSEFRSYLDWKLQCLRVCPRPLQWKHSIFLLNWGVWMFFGGGAGFVLSFLESTKSVNVLRAIHAKIFICLFSNSEFRSSYLDWNDHMFLFWTGYVLVMIALPNIIS
jgi:hypothetical protein